MEVWQTSSLRRLRLGEEKKDEDRRQKKPQGKNIWPALFHRVAIIKFIKFKPIIKFKKSSNVTTMHAEEQLAVLCGREGNRRSGVALAMHHRLCGNTQWPKQLKGKTRMWANAQRDGRLGQKPPKM